MKGKIRSLVGSGSFIAGRVAVIDLDRGAPRIELGPTLKDLGDPLLGADHQVSVVTFFFRFRRSAAAVLMARASLGLT